MKEQRDAAREALLFVSSKLGQLEQQRNHARWKLGTGKRRWRETRKAIEAALCSYRDQAIAYGRVLVRHNLIDEGIVELQGPTAKAS